MTSPKYASALRKKTMKTFRKMLAGKTILSHKQTPQKRKKDTTGF